VRVALLGSTGSIGRQAVDVLAALGDRFSIVALATGRDARTLESQAAVLRPHVVAVADATARASLDLPAGTAVEQSDDALTVLATRDDVDLVLVATGGVVSLGPVIAALAAGKVVATANKETLVSGGHLVMPLARRAAARVASRDPRNPYATPLAWLRPIDSEHSAIWQCLAGEDPAAIERLWLTSSGGPFHGATMADLARVTPGDALAHPTWSMGAKITIDSATLMNKGLEVIEANRLYDVDLDRITVVIHPQSIVHSAVEFVDGSIKAQLGQPDMRLPIQYALTFPARHPSPGRRLRLDELSALEFGVPDESVFPAVRVARDACRRGPWASAALIAADEVAVSRFLAGTLSFPAISGLVTTAVNRYGDERGQEMPSLEDLVVLDREVRTWCEKARPGATS
jgi:1-deoxy-D-xylulose-5-phosphate reductoisomerase